jgi:subtilisin family serine protease
MRCNLLEKTVSIILIVVFFVGFSFAIGMTYDLQRKIEELQRTDPRAIIEVIVSPSNSEPTKIDLTFFVEHNIRFYNVEWAGLMLAYIPVDLFPLLEKIDKIAGVDYLDIPIEVRPLEVISEGRDAIDATKFVIDGIDGKGVKLAVIDTGFKNFDILQRQGELPQTLIAKNFVGISTASEPTDLDPSLETQVHGSGCAEIIYDIAPGIDMYLLKVKTNLELGQALIYCGNNKINIASCSIGFDGDSFMDGTSSSAQKVDEVTTHYNVLCVIAAGNGAQKSWFGKYEDNSANPGFMKFANGSDLLSIQISTTATINLIWNDFTHRRTKYDLWIYEIDESTFISSTNYALGFSPKVSIKNPRGHTLYKLKIEKGVDTIANREMRIYISDDETPMNVIVNPVDENLESSISSPADSKNALTVGSVNVSGYASGDIDPYSARGPIRNQNSPNDSIKPDITAPSGVTTVSYGHRAFGGTSCACPHVAAAAALLLSLDPSLSTSTANGIFKKRILENINPVYAPNCPNNTYGYGKLILNTNNIPFNNIGDFVCYPNPVSLSEKGYIKITNFPFHTSLIDVVVYTVTGEFVKSFNTEDIITDSTLNKRMIKWDLRNQSGDLVAPGIYFVSIKTVFFNNQIKKIAISR